jgi:hypothetical protein
MKTTLHRRAAIGAIAAAGAMLAAPRAAEAASPDAELFALRGPIDVADGIFRDAFDALALAEKREMANLPVKPTAPPMNSAGRQTIEEFGLRMSAILEASSAENVAYDDAMRQWEQDKARAQVESGLDAAQAAQDAALEVVMKLETRLIETPAKTLAGLIFKAKYASDKDYDQDVMTSIVDDLLAMAGEA